MAMENWKKRVKAAQSKFKTKEEFLLSSEASALLKERELIELMGGGKKQKSVVATKKPCVDDNGKKHIYNWCHYKGGKGTSVEFHQDDGGEFARRFDAHLVAQTIIDVQKKGVNQHVQILYKQFMEQRGAMSGSVNGNGKRSASLMMDSGRNGANLGGKPTFFVDGIPLWFRLMCFFFDNRPCPE